MSLTGLVTVKVLLHIIIAHFTFKFLIGKKTRSNICS